MTSSKLVSTALFTLPLIFLSTVSLNGHAEDETKYDITMNITDHRPGHHRAHKEIKRLVAEYMLEKGDITLAELEQQREEKRLVREELRTLRERGDREALKARLHELREQKADRREQFRDYLAQNDQLAQAIREKKKQLKERRRERAELRQQPVSDE